MKTLLTFAFLASCEAACLDLSNNYEEYSCCNKDAAPAICSVYDMLSDDKDSDDNMTKVYSTKEDYPSDAVYDAVMSFTDANAFHGKVGHLIPSDEVWVVEATIMTLQVYSKLALLATQKGNGESLSFPSSGAQITKNSDGRFSWPFRTRHAFFQCDSKDSLIIDKGGSTPVVLPVPNMHTGLEQLQTYRMNAELSLFNHPTTGLALASAHYGLESSTTTSWAQIADIAKAQNKTSIYVTLHACWCPYTWSAVWGYPSNAMLTQGCESYDVCKPLSTLQEIQQKSLIVVIFENLPRGSHTTPAGDLSSISSVGDVLMKGPGDSCRNFAYIHPSFTLLDDDTKGFDPTKNDHDEKNVPHKWFERYESQMVHTIMIQGVRETDAFPLFPHTSFMRTPTGVILKPSGDSLYVDMRSNYNELDNTPGKPGSTLDSFKSRKC
jgi:hypothetical protein